MHKLNKPCERLRGGDQFGGGGTHVSLHTNRHTNTKPTVQEERPACIEEPGHVVAGLHL